jgi:hypothetical protein
LTADSADDWRRLTSSWRDSFRRGALKPIAAYEAPDPVIVQYASLGNGSAFHTQDFGWRMAVDVLYKQLIERQDAREGRTAEESRTHKKFDALFTRQITYPYLAAWRLTIEVAMKQLLVDVHSALEVPLPSKVERLLGGHDISELWRRYVELVPQFSKRMDDTAQLVGVAKNSPGLDLSFADCQVAIGRIVHIDPDGQHLRYRSRKDGTPNMSAVLEIDLADTHARLTHTYNYLTRCANIALLITQIRESQQILDSL